MSGEMIERPEWLVGTPKEDWGTDELSNYIVPPRMKVVQALSSDEITSVFDAGSVIISPQRIQICEKNGSFYFTPIFFFAEWIGWNPIGTQPAVRERSLDPTSAIARKAKAIQTEVIDGMEVTYSEHLNYVVVIHGNSELQNTPIVMGFARGEHRAGSNLSALVKMRNAPLYGCRFVGTSELRSGQKGKWWGITCNNPPDEPFVSQEEFNVYRDLHNSYKEAAIQVNYEDDGNTIDADSKESEF